jgi:hypothetical protein
VQLTPDKVDGSIVEEMVNMGFDRSETLSALSDTGFNMHNNVYHLLSEMRLRDQSQASRDHSAPQADVLGASSSIHGTEEPLRLPSHERSPFKKFLDALLH